jgi:hypothetical protein
MGPDALDKVPILRDEALQAIQDQIRGDRPSTVIGLLLDLDRTVELYTMAGLLRTTVTEVGWTLEVLAQEGYVRTYDDGGLRMVALTQAWSDED